ncbi:MAG: DUF5050 domain-containing protein [Bacilli bacterium]|jgi:hypothetical protein|nr:DUF5050 domain-containing protein [Bacilli bacterium]
MKKKIMLVAFSSLLLLSACGGTSLPVESLSAATSETGNSLNSELKEFTGLVFNGESLTYDGKPHYLTVENVPEGAEVTYSGNGYVEAAEYVITATIKKDGYKDKTMEAKLKIYCAYLNDGKLAELGISFKDATYPFDGEVHQVQLVGDLPAGTNFYYMIGPEKGNSAIEVGEYQVTCNLGIPNYYAYTMTAKLTITAEAKTLYSSVVGSSILFQNDLDNDTLYAYNTSLKKLSNDVSGGFSGTGNISFGIVKSLYGKAVYSYVEDGQGGIKKTKVLEGIGVKLLAAVDSTHFYYSVHNLTLNKADDGIYFYDTTKAGEDYFGDKIINDDFATDMTVSGGVLYYVNSEKNIVSYTGGVKTTYFVDGNVYDLTAKNNCLYYNKGSIAAKGLYRLDIASKKETKLTIDNGKDLSIIGNNLYYVNKDLLSSNIFGKGIYRIPLDGTFGDLSGTRVVDGSNDKVGSLATDGTSLYYYRFNTSHFYKNSASGEAEADLMASFVKPEDNTLVGCAFNKYFREQVYFLNMKDAGCLYKYDLKTRKTIKVLPYSVSNIYFNGEYMYFGSYILTNYAEWRMSLETKVITKISTDRCESLRFTDTKIYYINVGPSKSTLHSMDLDGKNDIEIVSDGMDPFSLEVIDDKAYSIRDPAVGYKKLAITNLTTRTVSVSDNKCLSFVMGEHNRLYLNNGADKKIDLYETGSSSSLGSLVEGAPKLTDLAFVNGHLYAKNADEDKLVVLQDNALTALADISASSITGEREPGTPIFFTAAKTSWGLDNYPVTTYVKGTSDGALYSFDKKLKQLVSV